MTVAAGIEIATGGTVPPVQGRVAAGRQNAGATAQGALPSAVPEAGSFRSGLQSLLASLSAKKDSLGDAQGNPDRVGSQAGLPSADASGTASASAAASTLSSSASVRIVQASTTAKGQTDAAANLSMAEAQGGATAGRRAGEIRSQAATKTGQGRTTANRSAESAGSTRSAGSNKSAQQDAVPATSIPGTIQAVTMAPPAAATAMASGSVPIATAEAQCAQTVGASDLAGGWASGAIDSRSLGTDGEIAVTGAVNSAGRGTTERAAGTGVHGNVSTVGRPAKSSSPVSQPTESSTGGEEQVSAASSMRERTGHTLETAAPGRASMTISAADQGRPSTPPASQGSDTGSAPIVSQGADGLSVAASAVSAEVGQSSGFAPVTGKPGAAGSKTAAPETARAHATGKLESVQQGSRGAEGQVSATTGEVSTMAHDLSGARDTTSTSDNTARSTVGSESGARETFAALDAESAQSTPTWVHAGAQRAEAGFEDPALGWVGVRADLSGGGVHAAVVPGSADAAEALGSHLAGLNTYLAEHHSAVGTVTMAAPEGGWAESGHGTGQAMHQGTGQQSRQETAQGAEAGSQFSPSSDSTGLRVVSSAFAAGSGEMSGSALEARPGSVHISVIA